MKPLLRSGLLLLYSLVVASLVPLLRLLGQTNCRLRSQIAGRAGAAELARRIAPARAARRNAVVFYCSSAGEFEQARPLIDRLAARGDTYVHTLFFSRSGHDYAVARAESLPMSLTPPTDSVWQWGLLFAALRPTITAVIRHELWPGFLETARNYGRVMLLDAGWSSGEDGSWLKRLVRRLLLRQLDRVYAIAERDAEALRRAYALAPERLAVTGDTKYDRARERATARPGEIERLRRLLDATTTAPRRLILGSAHRPDLEAVLTARRRLTPELAASWQLVVAPHHVDAANIGQIVERLDAEGLKVARYSELPALKGGCDAVVVDAMGLLAELYGTAVAAFVGGALHHQVHNVLEPASHGLAMAFGPFYKSSAEAVVLADAGLVTVTADAEALAVWWRGLEADLDERRQKLSQAVAGLCGATDRIYADWRPILDHG